VRLLDIGCGWGGLVMYAAQHYGVEAYGITLSLLQAELAQKRIAEAGLSERCRVEVRDYRDVNEEHSFDKIVSVGMFEHVGQALLPTYFQQAWHLLRPGGVFLNHGIASVITEPQRESVFNQRYVFPDGELVPISTTLRAAETSGFEVRDVESLREHYALTLRHWVRRLESHADEVRQLTGDVTYRIWRIYMSASIHAFLTGRNNIYQTLLAKPDRGNSHLPLTRADWYV
jgi:cyclopropane-fatty-acyl-phospholipid synthase